MHRAALAGALLLLLLNLLGFGATLYHQDAEQRLDSLPDERAGQASALAASLAPWSTAHHALHGWILAESADPEAAGAAYARALRRAPADALLWAEYALALGRNRIFDAHLTLATRRALVLAPASPAVRQSVSRMGLSYWRHGSAELRDLWRQSLRWELDHNRGSFLHAVEQDGYRRAFCADHAADLGESAWCPRAPA